MSYETCSKQILQELTVSLGSVQEDSALHLTHILCGARRVFVVGVGRVLLMLQAFAKRLNHLGIDATYVGAIDEPAITKEDVLLVGSGSGESVFPLAIVKLAKQYQATIVHIGSNEHSSMAPYEDFFLRIPCKTKLDLADEIASCQPMSSLFEQSLLLLFDTIAMMIIEERQITDLHSLWRCHANLE